MLTSSENLMIVVAILLIMLILYLFCRMDGNGDQFLSWLTAIGFLAEAFILLGVFLLRFFPGLLGNSDFLPAWEELAALFQMLTLVSWFLIGYLLTRTFNPKMSASLRWLLGMSVSFFVTTTVGNFLYELLMF